MSSSLSRSLLPRVASGASAATILLAAATALAATDAVVMDPSVGAQSIGFTSASSPTMTALPIVFTPPTRDAYTKAAPLQLPCDVDFLSVGVSWKNVSSQPLYVE